jgi:hypothetical protein
MSLGEQIALDLQRQSLALRAISAGQTSKVPVPAEGLLSRIAHIGATMKGHFLKD